MRLTCAALLIAAGLAASPARAQPVAPGGVFRLAAPPAGFKPDLASDAERAAYGLPPRPGGLRTIALDAWTQAMHAARVFIPPQVRVDGRRHGPAAMVGHTASNSSNWAGQAITNGSTYYNPGSYVEVLGQWVISGVQQAVGTCTSVDVSATWVGIDGIYGSSDVAQAGTEADAYCTAGATRQNIYAWFEWFPGNSYTVNIPTVVGGSMFVVVQSTSATTANATFVNLQTGQYTVVGFTAPAGTYLRGNSAEWIVERPSTGSNNTPGTLADFGEVPMESEIGYLYSELNTPYYNTPGLPGYGQNGYTLTMTNMYGTAIASTVPQGTSAQLVQVTGPTE